MATLPKFSPEAATVASAKNPERPADPTEPGTAPGGEPAAFNEGSTSDLATPELPQSVVLRPQVVSPASERASGLPTERPGPPANPFAGLLEEAEGVPMAEEPRHQQHTQQISGRGRTRRQAARPARLGQYQLLDELGSGGMAVVHRARQPDLDRLVAVKSLRSDYVHDGQVVERFAREATSLATLQHQNIVQIFDYVRDTDHAYIVMEYVDGIDVFELLDGAGRLPEDVAVAIGLEIATGLEYAHFRGIIHRDVKPSNILISRLGEVKIMDFGIARDDGHAHITQVGMALGTPAYMSPEQITGQEVDARADIFSFGVCLYEMLSGKKPWDDERGTAVARKILYEDPTPITAHNPNISPALAAIVSKCLDKDRLKRFPTTAALRHALEDFSCTRGASGRGRLVVYLANHQLIARETAEAFVPAELLDDPVLKQQDMGLPPPLMGRLYRNVIATCGIAALALCIAYAWLATSPL